MRDDEPRSGNEDSLHRLIAIGDSFTFGFQVSAEETYPNVLERLLNERGNGDQFDVLNLGVGGYSSRDEALALRHKGMRWNPRLVIVGYYLNDPEIDPIQPLHSHFQEPSWWQYSSLLRLVAEAKNRWDIRRWGDRDYFRYLHSPGHAKWQSVVEAFNDVAQVTQERGIPALVVIFPHTSEMPWADYPYRDLHRQVANAGEEAGLDVVDLYDEFSRHPPRNLMAPDDRHPSEFGHEVAAEAIYEWICRERKVDIPVGCR
jgi:lysophospholipase L1-like esterase